MIGKCARQKVSKKTMASPSGSSISLLVSAALILGCFAQQQTTSLDFSQVREEAAFDIYI